jgi:hypothetical protein
MIKYFDQYYMVQIKDNGHKILILEQQIIEKSMEIKKSEEKIQNLERKLLQYGKIIKSS